MSLRKKNNRKPERGSSASFASNSAHDIDTDGSGPSHSRYSTVAPRLQIASGTSSGHQTNGTVKGKNGRFLGGPNHQSSGSSIEANQNEENEAREGSSCALYVCNEYACSSSFYFYSIVIIVERQC